MTKKIIARQLYELLIYEDLSTELLPLREAGAEAATGEQAAPRQLMVETMQQAQSILISGRLTQLLTVLEFVLREGTPLLAHSLPEFKSVVSKAIQTTAETYGVFPQTIQAKLTVKCPEKLTLNEFVTKLYTFLPDIQIGGLPPSLDEVKNADFWNSVLSNCSDSDQKFAYAVISALWKEYLLPG